MPLPARPRRRATEVARATGVAAATEVARALRAVASPARAAATARFFKTGPGEYGEGDRFIGVTVPQQRRIAKAHRELPLPAIARLLASPWHEERLVALMILVGHYERATSEAGRRGLFRFYLRHLRHVDNWDLVDSSAAPIVGAWLEGRSKALLLRMARSPRLWTRRVAIIATFHDIRRGDARATLRIARLLLGDGHDLIHKAVGWMLREVGKRCCADTLRAFLRQHAARMPRTMLRYAIERFDAAERARWLAVRPPTARGRAAR